MRVPSVIAAAVVLGVMTGLAATDRAQPQSAETTLVPGERVESEYKLDVPDELRDEVWAYLVERYDGDDLLLNEYGDGFTTEVSRELFSDRYFDDGQLSMLNRRGGIRHRTRFFPNDTTHPKHGRSLLQIKLARPGDLAQNRTEIKFDARSTPGNPDVPSARDMVDTHPVIGLARSSEQDDFMETLQLIGVDPTSLRETLTLNQVRNRIYISRHGVSFATLTLDDVSVEKWWHTAGFTELELELSETRYTDASPEGRAFMEKMNDAMKEDVLEEFPAVTQDQAPKYQKAYEALEEKFVLFPLALRYRVPVEILLALGFVGLIAAPLAWMKLK